jgi:rhomboid protease GluP
MNTVATDLVNVAKTIAAPRPPQPEEEQFHNALRARTPRALVTPALIALNLAFFIVMVFGSGAPKDPETLVRWGANFGPRTTNGEWWRLVTALFVHSGYLRLFVNIAGLAQAGLMLERLVGPLAFATTFFAAGILPGLKDISEQPIGVSVGASAAIFGIYGLLVASFLLGLRRRSPATIPLSALRRLAPAAGVFILYNVALGGPPHLAGLMLGFACGIVLAFGVSDRKPSPLRVAIVVAAAAVAAVAAAVPLRGIADVRPEIARIAALDDRTTSAYDAAVLRFRNGRMTAEALARYIDREILPDLTAALARLRAIHGVPRQHQSIVAAADEYLRLRQDSFRLRAEGLRKGSMQKLQQAERREAAAREALEKIAPVEPPGG